MDDRRNPISRVHVSRTGSIDITLKRRSSSIIEVIDMLKVLMQGNRWLQEAFPRTQAYGTPLSETALRRARTKVCVAARSDQAFISAKSTPFSSVNDVMSSKASSSTSSLVDGSFVRSTGNISGGSMKGVANRPTSAGRSSATESKFFLDKFPRCVEQASLVLQG